jgi:hypothetical protein
VNSGVSAFLLEETEGRPDIFQISVGRLPPGSVATILLTYITEVAIYTHKKINFDKCRIA